MRRIKMLATSAGPDGVMLGGKVYPVDDATAKALVAGKYAEYVDPPVKTERTAMKDETMEQAVKPTKPVHVGGGWYDLPTGERVHKSDLAKHGW